MLSSWSKPDERVWLPGLFGGGYFEWFYCIGWSPHEDFDLGIGASSSAPHASRLPILALWVWLIFGTADSFYLKVL